MSELMRLHPGDLKLADELKDISARKTLSEGGYEALSDGSGSYRDILKDKSKAEALEQESRQVKKRGRGAAANRQTGGGSGGSSQTT